MGDGKDLVDVAAAEPDPDEEQPDLEEEGELEAAGGGGEEEEDVDVDGLASFLEFEILSGSSEEDPVDVSALDLSFSPNFFSEYCRDWGFDCSGWRRARRRRRRG